MANESIPYLCGGTFFTQLLRTRPVLTTSTEHTKGHKESLSEQETFRRLISVYQMKDFMNCSSLKTYTSQFKTCTNSLEAFTSFSDANMKWSFDKDVKSSDSSALILMSNFVQSSKKENSNNFIWKNNFDKFRAYFISDFIITHL